MVKRFGIKFGEKFVQRSIEKIPGKVLTRINQKVGFRFITKFGQKGLINLGELIPGVGAVINGGFDFLETKAVAHRAYKMFIESDFTVGNDIKTTKDKKVKKENVKIIDTEFTDVENKGKK